MKNKEKQIEEIRKAVMEIVENIDEILEKATAKLKEMYGDDFEFE